MADAKVSSVHLPTLSTIMIPGTENTFPGPVQALHQAVGGVSFDEDARIQPCDRACPTLMLRSPLTVGSCSPDLVIDLKPSGARCRYLLL
eukprot:3939155-Rhodomonas_salina.1